MEMMGKSRSLDYSLSNEYMQQPVKLAGYGFIQGHLPQGVLSSNAVDIESFLFGINSTDLTRNEPKTLVPQLHTLNNENVIGTGRRDVILPHSFTPQPNQRPTQ